MPKKEYNYIRKYFTFDGQPYEVYGKTEEEALEKKLRRLQELEAGRVTANTTVKEWAAVWYQTYCAPRPILAKSKAMYKGCLDREIVPAIGKKKQTAQIK